MMTSFIYIANFRVLWYNKFNMKINGGTNMLKRIISAAVSAAIAVSAFAGMTVSAADDGLIFALDFDNQTVNASVGKVELFGDVAYEEDGNGGYAARLGDKRGNYLSITNEDGTPL